MAAEKEITETKRMPMIAMRGIVLFPNMILHFDVGRKKSIAALEEVMKGDRTVFLSAQKIFRRFHEILFLFCETHLCFCDILLWILYC